MRRICCCVLLLFFLFAPAVSYAHSGDVDSFGGHFLGGNYHYHHGHPAHEHTGGVCPYGDYLGRQRFYEGYYSFWDGWDGWPYVFAFGFFLVGGGLWLAVSAIRDKYYELRFNRRVARITARANGLASLGEDISYARVVELFERIPDGVMIGNDYLPREVAATHHWGDKYTVFVTYLGKYYHTKDCFYGHTPVHVCKRPFGLKPCPKCHPRIPDLSWCCEFLRVHELREKYKMNESDPLIIVGGRSVRRPRDYHNR